MHSVSEGLAIVEDKLEIPQASLLEERPLRLLAAFAIAQHHDVELSARAQRLIRQHIHLVDDVFREDPEAADLFRRILGSPTRVYRSLQLMDELGLLGAYLPEFGRLVGMWQQDMYHTYTVDVHSLFLVEQLRRLRKGRFRDELPLATGLMREVRSPEVLFLACMVHDIGKGLGGGHSEKGARMVPALAKRLGLEDGEKELVEFIVRHHLTMSAMAEQRDVQDSAVILRLANLCGTRERLRSLFLSTIADIRSVSPEAWTRWKGGLLESLYRNTAEWLEAGQAGEASEFFLERAIRRAAETRAGGLRALEESGEDRERVERFFDELPPRYWLDHEPAQVAAHVRAGLAFAATGADVRVHSFAPSQGHQFWGVIVLAPDRPGLFSTVAGVLTALGHNILAAQVYTTRSGMAMEIYQVDPIAGGRDEELLEVERIEVRLRRALEGAEQPHPERPRQAAPRLVRAQPPSVRITNDESDFYSIVDVATHDRPALLHDLTRTLHSLGLEIVMSRAATRANRVTDAFYVTDDGHKIQGEERRAQIEARLHDVLRQSAG
jgi:[protein-PII] uridylyltransferase